MTGIGFVVIVFFLGLAAGVVGKLKGSSFFLWFMIGFFLPGIGLAAAALYRFESDEQVVRCPICDKRLHLSDQICTRCGAELYLVPPRE